MAKRLRFLTLPIGVLIALGPSQAHAQAPHVKDTLVIWGTPELSHATVLASGRYSWTPAPPDGDAGSLLFDSASVDLQGSEALSGANLTSFRIPVQYHTTRHSLVVKHDLRMFVQKDRHTRIRVILDIAGRTSIIDFPRGMTVNGDTTISVIRTLRLPSTAMVFSLLILVDRDSRDSPATLNIDSDDIIVKKN
jgi:hypothetical protein